MWIELYLEGTWQRCAELSGTAGHRQQPVQLTYSVDYAVEHLFARDLHAVSTRLPVDLGTKQYTIWPAFLIDLLPKEPRDAGSNERQACSFLTGQCCSGARSIRLAIFASLAIHLCQRCHIDRSHCAR